MGERIVPRRLARIGLVGALLVVASVVMAATGPAGAQVDPTPGTTIVVTESRLDAGRLCLAEEFSERVDFGVIVPSTVGATLSVAVADGLPAGVRVIFHRAVQARADDFGQFRVEMTAIVVSRRTDPLGPFSHPVDLTFTYTASDGSTAALTRTFSVTGTILPDCQPPTILVPSRVVVAATSPAGSLVTYGIVARDNVDLGSDPVICTPASGALFAIGTTRVDCSVADLQGNVGSAAFEVEVVVPPPVISGASTDITLEATGATTPVTWTDPTAVDLFGASLPVTCLPRPGDFSVGTVTVACSASDAYGGTGTSSFDVTVQDTTAPELVLPGPIAVVADSHLGRTVSWEVTAVDHVDGLLAPTCNPSSPALFPIGDTTVACTAADQAGNSTTMTFVVMVTDAPPVVNLPGPLTVEATGPGGAPVSFSATADDTTDGPLPVTCSPGSGDLFPLGTTTVDCAATDSFGHRTSGSFTVTVRDTTAPVVSVPADITVDPTGAEGAVVSWPAVSASDAVDGRILVDCWPASGATFGPGTTNTVTCTATDAAGNIGSASFTVTVRPFMFEGFAQPVDNSAGTAIVYNTVKGGSTVPLKFEVFAGSVELTSTSVIQGVAVAKVSCTTGADDAIEELSSTGGTSLRYDPTNGHFIQNWKTPRTPGACLRVTATTTSGSRLSAYFKLR